MKRGVILTILVLSILSLLFSSVKFTKVVVEAPNGFPVHNLDTGLNYTSIQGAINASETLDGHTIFVEEGFYSETVYVNKSISLIGENKHNTIIDGKFIGPIIWMKADNATINGFTIQNRDPSTGHAIRLDSNSNIVEGNIIKDSPWGLNAGSSNNIISRNYFLNNSWGLSIHGYGGNNTVQSNIIINNRYVGVGMGFSSWNKICDNNISENVWGLHISWSTNNTICRNEIAYNGAGGAIYLLQAPSDNRFYQNNFRSNENQLHVFHGGPNQWDNGFEGNYWSKYDGVDLDSDGIGNSPHVLDINNTDNYPLMGTFSNYNATSEYWVQTICNSTISEFNHNGTAISFDVTGENGSVGFCRICIPTALMNEYQVFVNGTEVEYTLLPVSNSTHSYLYFTYEHSTKEVVIIPELPSLILLPLFLLCTLLTTIFYRRKNKV